MRSEQLAPILYTREVEYSGIKATPWEGLHESHRRKWYVLAEAALAATFATPKPPEGWPDNWESGASGYMYSKDGAARLPSSEAGRLAAWAFSSGAPVQPTSTVDHGAEIEGLKAALALARRDEQRAQERAAAMRDVAEDFAERLTNLHRDNLQAMIEGADE